MQAAGAIHLKEYKSGGGPLKSKAAPRRARQRISVDLRKKILREYEDSGSTHADLALMFDVSESVVSKTISAFLQDPDYIAKQEKEN